MLGVVCVVLRLLACLLALPSLHPCFLQQSALLRKSSSLLPVFHLVLPDQGLRRTPKDVFVFAEFADPGLTRRVVEVGVLLLCPTFASSVCVQLRRTAPRLARWRCLLWRLATLRRWCAPIRRRMHTVHVWTCLGALCRYSRGVWSNGRTSASSLGMRGRRSGRGGIRARRLRVRPVFLARPNHLVC